MNIKNLNEELVSLLEDSKLADIIKSMENLQGKYFNGCCIDRASGKYFAEVRDINYETPSEDCTELCADYVQSKNLDIHFEDDERHAWEKWARFCMNRDEFVGKGYKFSDYVKGAALDDYKVALKRKEKPDLNSDLFVTLYIDVNEFDGDMKKLQNDMDKYIMVYKTEADKIKKSFEWLKKESEK